MAIDKKDSALTTTTPILTDKVRGLDDPAGTPDSVTFLLSAVKDLFKTSYDALYLALVAPSTSGNVLTSNGSAWISAAPAATPSKVVQTVYYSTGAMATGVGTIAPVDTIPINTSGNEYMTLAITPTNAANKLVVEVIANLNSNAAAYGIGAIFRDSTANALCVNAQTIVSAAFICTLPMRLEVVAGSTATTTFKFRAGGNVGTTTFNGSAGGRWFGGVLLSSMRITEYLP